MTNFQLDECSSSKALRADCNKQGLCSVRGYKKEHRGIPDVEMLRIYTAKDAVLLTFDKSMLVDHERDIPSKNPGIIVIAHSASNPRTITEKSAREIINNFKARFDRWHVVFWDNSIVTLTDETLQVGQKSENGIRFVLKIKLAESGWQAELENILLQNAGKSVR